MVIVIAYSDILDLGGSLCVVGSFAVGRSPVLLRDGDERVFGHLDRLARKLGADLAVIDGEYRACPHGVLGGSFYSVSGKFYQVDRPVGVHTPASTYRSAPRQLSSVSAMQLLYCSEDERCYITQRRNGTVVVDFRKGDFR